MTRWVWRLAWQQSQSFEAWSVSLPVHSQGRIDDWMRGPVEELVVRLIAQDALQEQLSLLLVELAREH